MVKVQRETTTNQARDINCLNKATDTNSPRITMAELSFNPNCHYQEEDEDVYNM